VSSNSDSSDHAPGALRSRAFWLLGRAARDAHRATASRLFEVGLKQGYYGVLATLDETGAASQAEIGRCLGVDPSDMVAIIGHLVQDGYVIRELDSEDRRRNSITLTESGRAALGRFDLEISKAEDELLANFSQAERATFIEMLTRLDRGARLPEPQTRPRDRTRS